MQTMSSWDSNAEDRFVRYFFFNSIMWHSILGAFRVSLRVTSPKIRLIIIESYNNGQSKLATLAHLTNLPYWHGEKHISCKK